MLVWLVTDVSKGIGNHSNIIINLENKPNIIKANILIKGNNLKIIKGSLKDSSR